MPRFVLVSMILSISNCGQVSIPSGNFSHFMRAKCNTSFVGIVLLLSSSLKYTIGLAWFKIVISISILQIVLFFTGI